ncbi:hypothetical protein A5641_13550 [Mycobacterium sp. 1554424.7]|nr:hypothetical protein A5641_13550 [Mycobacterium sp. 1554424.7]
MGNLGHYLLRMVAVGANCFGAQYSQWPLIGGVGKHGNGLPTRSDPVKHEPTRRLHDILG